MYVRLALFILLGLVAVIYVIDRTSEFRLIFASENNQSDVNEPTVDANQPVEQELSLGLGLAFAARIALGDVVAQLVEDGYIVPVELLGDLFDVKGLVVPMLQF